MHQELYTLKINVQIKLFIKMLPYRFTLTRCVRPETAFTYFIYLNEIVRLYCTFALYLRRNYQIAVR